MEFYDVIVGNNSLFSIPKRYVNICSIGDGAQGTVCSAFDTELGINVAIKKLYMPFRDDMNAKRAFREIKLMKLVNHKKIISLLSAFTPQNNIREFKDIYLVMDLMESTLNQIAKPKALEHDQISYLIYQLLCGINHLHRSNIIHRDLKPSNIGVKSDCTLKILDFGLARYTNGGDFTRTPYVVTRHYRAPEVIFGMNYDKSVDIWSVGCIMAELATGQIPIFPGETNLDQWDKIIRRLGTPSKEYIGFSPFLLSLPHYKRRLFNEIFPDDIFPPGDIEDCRDLLSKMLVIDPKFRISVQEALVHPYIKKWNEESEVNSPLTDISEFVNDPKGELSIDKWRRLIFEELLNH